MIQIIHVYNLVVVSGNKILSFMWDLQPTLFIVVACCNSATVTLKRLSIPSYS